jgi:hypothetical protein
VLGGFVLCAAQAHAAGAETTGRDKHGTGRAGDTPPRSQAAAANNKASVTAARRAARRAFKAKRYATACPLYQKIVTLQPDDPPSRADLAFCLQRLGRKEEAIATNYEALALGARTDRSPDGDAATRRHAYHNLSELGVTVDVPNAACGPLPPAPGCAKRLWMCNQKGEAQGARGGTTWTILRIGTSADDASFASDERQNPETVQGYDFHQRTSTADLVIERHYESILSMCESGDECPKEDTDCELVVANACLGLIGAVCTYTDGKDDESTSVDEAYVDPAR